jgi:hypothetical protein
MAVNTDGMLLQWHEFRTYVTGAGGGLAGLQIAPLSYSLADATTIFNTSADLEQLYQIYIGAQNLAVAKDFRVSGLNAMGGLLIH